MGEFGSFQFLVLEMLLTLGSCVWKWWQLVLKSGRVSEQDGLGAIDLFGAFWMFSPEGEVGNGAGIEVFWNASVLEHYTEPPRLLLPPNKQPTAPRLPSVPLLHLLVSLAPSSLDFRPCFLTIASPGV